MLNWLTLVKSEKVDFFPQLNFVNVNEGDIKYRYSLWCCEGYPLKVLVWNMLVIVIKAVELFFCHTGGIFCQIYFSCFFSSSFFLSNIRTIFVIKMKMLPDLAFVSLALCIFFLLWKWYLWVKSLLTTVHVLEIFLPYSRGLPLKRLH